MKQRLIDANALHRIMMSKGKDKLRLAAVINEIELAPTIEAEPVRHGQWIVQENDGVSTIFACSCCQREVKSVNDYFGKPTNHIATRFPYCHCGAKMHSENEK